MTSPYLHSARWRIAYMGLLNGFMVYLFRTNLNMTLPSMVKSTSNDVTNDVNVMLHTHTNETYGVGSGYTKYYEGEECAKVSKKDIDEPRGAEFSWNKKTQSFVLSSYYYGFLAAQVMFGLVVGRLGGKNVITFSMAASAALTLLVPVLARASVYALIAARVGIGIFTGASIPSWYTLLSRWALPHERSRFIGVCWFGQYFGTIVGYFGSGFLCAKGFDNGWGSVYYIHGIIGVAFVFLWQYVVVEYPENHPRISEAELRKLTSRSTGVDKKEQSKTLKIPWMKIFTHGPVLAMTVTYTMDCFVHYFVLICLPLYMKGVLKFDIQSNGVFSSLPFISSAVGLFISGNVADYVIKRQCLSNTNTRKVVQITASIGTAVCICLPGFMSCSQRAWVIVSLCAGMFFQASGYSAGYLASPVDIAPRFASVIFAVSNIFCTLSGIFSPFVVAQLTTHDTVAEWRIVFFIATGCSLLAALVFGLFSSSERAPWADDQNRPMEITIDAKELHVTKPLVSSDENNITTHNTQIQCPPKVIIERDEYIF